MKYFITSLIILISIAAHGSTILSETSILTAFQPNPAINKNQQEVSFWTDKYNNIPSQRSTYAVKLASAYSGSFNLTGEIEHLIKAENLLLEALEPNPLNKSAIQRSLAKNYISQHRFCEALDLLNNALTLKEGMRATKLMQYDVYMELNEQPIALQTLSEIENQNSFEVLIRKAKWEDHEGRLDRAIVLLEEAKILATESRNIGQMSWIYSNLGDFYGHQGNYEKSKEHFISAIDLNPADWYSVKGLAWMSWSLNNDAHMALSLLDRISLTNKTPSIQWLALEIKSSMGENNPIQKERLIQDLRSENYGSMYDHILFEEAVATQNATEATRIAIRQVSERPTAQSYAMLARAYDLNDQTEIANAIIDQHIINQTYEPGVLSMVYPVLESESNNQKMIYHELKEAKYELGPVAFENLNI